MRSLRARLLAATAAVLAAVLTALALFSARVTRIEFHRFEDVLVTERGETLVSIQQLLEAAYRAGGGWTGAPSAVERAASLSQKDVFVVDRQDVVIARSAGIAHAGITTEGPSTFRIEWHDGPPRQLLLRAPGMPIRDDGGRSVGRFYAIPRDASPARPRRDYAGAVNRWLASAAAAAGILALFLIAALARRLFGPIESLTDAALRMEAGDRTARVPVVSSGPEDELGRLARSFNAMADAIARQETLRRNLVSDVAHELRTPLTSLRAQLESLQDGIAAPDARMIDSLHEDARLLERLVDDLQELALAEAGQLTLHPGAVPLDEAADRAASAVRAPARENSIEFVVEVPSGLVVLADRDRLGQILANLLGNALAHTPAGGRIRISARMRGEEIETVVSDTGSGIEARHLPHVFDRFYRTDPSRARETGGTGLGLAIVRQLVEAQGGAVRAASEPGRGTVITFTLPAAVMPSAADGGDGASRPS